VTTSDALAPSPAAGDLFPEADCFTIYRRIRAGVPADAQQLGQGYNRYPPAPGLLAALQQALTQLFATGRFEQYSCAADDDERALFAMLLGRRLGRPDLAADDVVFTNGGSEAISVLTGGLAAAGLSLALPIPNYYVYEQAALRHRVPVIARYRADWPARLPASDAAVVTVLPNGVTGELAPAGPGPRPGFEVLDIIYQLAGESGTDLLSQEITSRAGGLDLERGALILTPSKDLSLAAFRAGALVTRHPVVRSFAERDRHERTFTVSPLVARICIVYLSACLLYNQLRVAGAGGFDSELAWLTAGYAEFGVPLLLDRESWWLMVTHLESMTAHLQQMSAVLGEYADILDPASVRARVAGYSVFPRLNVAPLTSQALVEWVNCCGVGSRLKLNPTVLFGGTTRSWDELFPGEARIRLNLSVPAAELHRCLAVLRERIRRRPPPERN